MSERRNWEAGEMLARCRTDRDTNCGLAVRGLLRVHLAYVKDELVTAPIGEVTKLQGAAVKLRELIRLIESDPPATRREDGAYV
ncbi:hypothetical protein [Desulfovibrio inopinatus]|uniref:hypothetical protein n=1 Tax=Desulfovibrio inopinatus TaxID=102109 RepID=UPI0003FB5F62|nr:hypothetical protein [Desulfovibrio inopinatus]